MTTNFLNRQQLLEKRPRRVREVEIPEIGGKVLVQSLTALERGNYEAQFYDKKTGQTKLDRLARARELLTIATVVDENGTRLFGPDDVKELNNVDVKILERIVTAAKELSGISDKDEEDLVGN